MAEGINVRFSGALKDFVESKSGESGLYQSVSEYIRDLVRKDFEAEESKRWSWLKDELAEGLAAREDEFISWSADDIIAEAKIRKQANQ